MKNVTFNYSNISKFVSEKEIKEYVDEIIGFLINKGADAVVIACNTATSVAVSDMRKKYDLPILGMEPIVAQSEMI